MAATRRGAGSALIDLLEQEPYKFDFFQAVRLLGILSAEPEPGGSPQRALGFDGPPGREFVRFASDATLTFPSNSVSQINVPTHSESNPAGRRMHEMVTTFLGLTGANGALPHHYTRRVIDNLRNKDQALAKFFDLFNHRTISLFFRAWEKYRFPFLYEHAALRSESKSSGHYIQMLLCLVGMGVHQRSSGKQVDVRRRLHVEGEALLYFSGHFAHFPRSAIGLQSVLAEYLGFEVRIEQFVAQWLYLDVDQQFRFSAERSEEANCAIGVNAVVGKRVRNFDSRIRVHIGPLTYAEFMRFFPTNPRFHALCQLIRLYIGPETDFDVQLSLYPQEVPWCRLGGGGDPPQLGYNMWVRNRAFLDVVDDPVFTHDGRPCCDQR